MARSADVRSIDALRDFRVALLEFIDFARRSLATAESEVQRMDSWLTHEQPESWKRQVRHRKEMLAQSKSELFRATISQPDNPRGPVDEQRRVRKCEEAIREAEDKLARTKRWAREFVRGAQEYHGATAALGASLDGELTAAAGKVDRAISTLEVYLADAPDVVIAEETPDAASIARRGDQEEAGTDEHADGPRAADEGDAEADAPLD